jgi:biopolymer transport protein ExbB/TolQ
MAWGAWLVLLAVALNLFTAGVNLRAWREHRRLSNELFRLLHPELRNQKRE